MEEQGSSGEEDGSIVRGVLHRWQGYSCHVTPERLLLPRPVLQAALGTFHGLLLTEDGLVYSFGEQAGRRTDSQSLSPVLESALSSQHVISVSAGSYHSSAITEDGVVHMWGRNSHGQCGTFGVEQVPNPTPVSVVDAETHPPQAVRILNVACGVQHTLALSSKHEVWAWGSGNQLGLVANLSPVFKPQKVEHLVGRCVVQIACGGFHSLALVQLPSSPEDLPESRGQCEQCKQGLYTMTDKDDHVIISDEHYCPLGVELADVKHCEKSEKGSPAQTPQFKRSDEDTSSMAYSNPANESKSTDKGSQPSLVLDASYKALQRSKSTPYPDENALKDYLKRILDQSDSSSHPPLRQTSLTHTFPSEQSDGLPALNGTDQTHHARALSCDLDQELPLHSTSDDSSQHSSVDGGVFISGLNNGGLSESSQVTDISGFLSADDSLSTSLTDITLEDNRAHSHSVLPSPRLQSKRRRTALDSTSAFKNPLPSLYTEVWSWGRGQEGQLGHGDYLPRLQPLCIKNLSKKEIVKISSGANHSMALTAQCQVYSWGSNKFGQLGHTNSPSTVPNLIQISEGIRVWDVAAGQTHTVLLADGDCYQPILYYSGEQVLENTSGDHPLSGTYTQTPTLLPFCIHIGYVSNIVAGGLNCLALADQNAMGFISTVHELASAERKFYCFLCKVKKQILDPLLGRESLALSLGQSSMLLFQEVSGSFIKLGHLTGQHSVSLTNFLQQGKVVNILALIQSTAIFIDTYKEYSEVVGNFLVMGGFQALLKPLQECCGKKLELIQSLMETKEKNMSPSDLLVTLFYWPLLHLQGYNRLLLKLTSCFEVSSTEFQLIHVACSKFEAMSRLLSKKRKDAENTFAFWKNFRVKNSESLHLPTRRLVCESSNKALTLQNAGRFTASWFILFNDVLVHAQGTMPSKKLFSSHHIYPLATLWVQSVSNESLGVLGLKLTTPEETLIVSATPFEKGKWLRYLNQTIDDVLSTGPNGRALDVGGLQKGRPPASRTSTYTFSKEGRLKDATYEGRWLTGKPHGKGTLKWPDGTVYCGTFKNGLEDGFGSLTMPPKNGKTESYKGHWREAKMHGFGKYTYCSGEVYEGFFKDNVRHGYGILRSGKSSFPLSSSVFVGHWVQGKKTGYGVCDDFSKGEKYMGMWQEDQRHGNGVVVNQFGLYYEGNFADNKMSGSGVLLCDDDTVFEGEFSDDWTIFGKGNLSMPNGDSLDGDFRGDWVAGLKVSGFFKKPYETMETARKEKKFPEAGRQAVQAKEKWKAVFEECWSQLGCETPGQGENEKAWEKIAISLTARNRRQLDSPEVLSRSQNMKLECLEVIPQHLDALTCEAYNNIRRYLMMACETPQHPLGWLLETLVTVYRMTYVGVGSNRRLLRQAVEEIQSYLQHIFQIIRFLFPALPDDGSFIQDSSTPTDEGNGSLNDSTDSDTPLQGQMVSCSNLLLPVLLPRVYPPLFVLYTLEREKEEAVYWSCVLRLNKHPDYNLLDILGVQRTFWPVSVSVLGEKKQILPDTKDVCFATAVETLQQISSAFTPADKLQVIHRTFEELTQEVTALRGPEFMWSMDDLFPIFLYVVHRARIKNLGSEVNLTEDLTESSLQLGQLGFMLTTLKACYNQILSEKNP